MKIAWDAKRAFWNSTGLGVYSRNIIEYFTKNYTQYEYLLITPKISDKIWKKDLGTSQVISPRFFVFKFLHSAWRSIGIGLWKYRKNLTIYHGLAGELPLYIPKKCYKIVTIHDILFIRYPKDYPWIDRTIYKLKTEYAIKKADKIVAVSEATKSDLIEKFAVPSHKIKIIPNTFEPLQTADSPSQKVTSRPFVVMVSTFIARKNQLLLARAYERIANNVPFDLIFIGSGRDYYQKVRSEVAKFEHTDRIFFVPNCSRTELIWYYQNALFSVYPSQYEGFGIPVLESIFYYCPVLVSDVKPLRDLGGELAYYFESNDEDDLVNKLIEMNQRQQVLTPQYIDNRKKMVKKYAPRDGSCTAFGAVPIYLSIGSVPLI